MERLSHRPLALFCLSFVYMGFVSALLLYIPRILLTAVLAVGCVCLFLPFSARMPAVVRRIGRLVLCGLLSGSVFFGLYSDLFVERNIRLLDGQRVEVIGAVESREYSTSYSAGYCLRLHSVNGEPARFRILLNTFDTTLEPGDVLFCEADLSAFAEYSNSFAEKKYYISRGIYLEAETDLTELVGKTGTGLRGFFEDLRSLLSARLQVTLGRTKAALPVALLLGDRSLLPDSVNRDFRRLGISHMLAISGFHFTLLLGMAERLLQTFLPSKKVRLPIMAGLTVFYMFLSGMSDSVLRSGVMMLLLYAASLLNRQNDPPTSLGINAALICIFQPASFYSAALQLSVTSVLALLCFSHVKRTLFPAGNTRPFLRFLQTIALNALLPVAVQLVLLPLTCLYFGELSLLTSPATILFTPLIQLLLILSPLLLAFPYVQPLVQFFSWITDSIVFLSEWLSSWRGITVSVTYPLCVPFACLLAGCFGATALLQSKRQICRTLALLLTVSAVFGGYLAIENASLTRKNAVISVQTGNNDGLILLSEGRFLLCDVSDGSYKALSAFADTASRRHATEIECLLLTHLHKRHIQSFDRLSEDVCIRSLLLPVPVTPEEESIFSSLLELAKEKKIPVRQYDAAKEAVLQFGAAEILPGERTYLSRSTHPVITLRVQFSDQSLQYLGTSWNETKTVPAPADVLLLGGHGPIYKKKFLLSPSRSSALLVLRGESGDYLSGNSSARIVRSDEEFFFQFADSVKTSDKDTKLLPSETP